jgi:molybdopterin-containing oxidoreductase family iron-sulfur binding subunit
MADELVPLKTRADRRSDRRGFLKGLGIASAAVASSPASAFDWDRWFKTHYKEMTDEDKKRIFSRIEREQEERYGVRARVDDPPPIPGVRFAFGLDLNKCNGNRLCVHACMEENNQSRNPPIQYIRVLELDSGTFDLESGDMHYDGIVPREGKVYLPVQCNQCENPPCVKACPVQATWKEPDGITVIDYDWCIGCRYCMAACPYEARRFNFAEPELSRSDVNPNQGYLSNRPRPRGVVEKCHFCLHRTRRGHYPACLEACPTGARKFGDLNDPNSEVSLVLKHKRVFVLKEELNTMPHFFYYFG